MLSIVLQPFIVIVRPLMLFLLWMPLVGALMSCDDAKNFERSKFDFKASEPLPDGNSMLFIELAGLGGQLSLLDLETDKYRILY